MDDDEVRALFRQAIAGGDATAMRKGIELLLGLGDGGGLSAEQEYAVRHADYVMEMPQSNERIRGRDAMRSMQEACPTPPGVRSNPSSERSPRSATRRGPPRNSASRDDL